MTITVRYTATCQGDAKRHEDILMSRAERQQDVSDREAPEYSDQYLLERMIAAGIGSLDDWRALSPRARRNVFGITVSMARAIDSMAKARRHSGS